MSHNILFSGNSQKAPRPERLNTVEVPILQDVIYTGDLSVGDIYGHVVRMPLPAVVEQAPQSVQQPAPQTHAAAASNVIELASYPQAPSAVERAQQAVQAAFTKNEEGNDVQEAA